MTECIHIWKISGQDGPVSKGLCRKCGEERQFLNSLPSQRTPKGMYPGTSNYKSIPRGGRTEKLVMRSHIRSDLHESGSSFDDAVRIVEGG